MTDQSGFCVIIKTSNIIGKFEVPRPKGQGFCLTAVLRGGEQNGQFLNTGNIRRAGLKKGPSMPLYLPEASNLIFEIDSSYIYTAHAPFIVLIGPMRNPY